MTTNGKTPEHVQRTNAARTAAVKRLIEAHQDEWRKIYAEEATARGIAPRSSTREQKIAQLEAKLAELRSQQ